MFGKGYRNISRTLNVIHSVEALNVSLIKLILLFFIFSSVMFWSNEHEVFLWREVVNLNPFTSKKGFTQRSGMWEKIAQSLNECTVLRLSVAKRSVRDHMGTLVNKHKKITGIKSREK